MRSRYTAYVLRDDAHLLATWHASTRPAHVMPDPATKWLGLEVHDHQRADESHAEVEFVARYRLQGRGGRLRERSRFVREADGRWYYVDVDAGERLLRESVGPVRRPASSRPAKRPRTRGSLG